MKILRTAFVCLISAFPLAANAQVSFQSNADPDRNSSKDEPSAFVYVVSKPARSSENQIETFAAAADGKLTPISGSPFQENVTNIAVNGKYLAAVNGNGFDIDSYRIESDGALHFETSKNASKSDDCNILGPLFFDLTGRSLYDMETDGSGCANNTYESFSVAASDGRVESLGDSGGNAWLILPASFIGNNTYAYTASCIQDMYWGIYGFKRGSNGDLHSINMNGAPPTPPDGYFYCPSSTATDSTDHVAIVMQPVNQNTFNPDRPAQLATYTADKDGNLNTLSTATNMPRTEVGSVNDLKISPSGKLVAIAGTAGLQVFHFNGKDPITRDTGRLTKDAIDLCFWDRQNHLYAISNASGKLFVFTVTATKAGEGPGSPYEVSSPQDLAVQSVQ